MSLATLAMPATINRGARIKQTNISAMVLAVVPARRAWTATKYLFSRGFMHE